MFGAVALLALAHAMAAIRHVLITAAYWLIALMLLYLCLSGSLSAESAAVAHAVAGVVHTRGLITNVQPSGSIFRAFR
jgi:hypothetical protein